MSPAGLGGLSVTVVGIYYAPDSTGIAPYTTDLCRTLAAEGAEVRAVVGVPHYPQWKVDPAYRLRPVRTSVEDNVRVTRVRHFVPRRQDAVRRGLYELSFFAGSALAAGRRPDVVLGVTPALAGAATAGLLAASRSVPLGIVVQDLAGQAATQSGIRGGSRVAGGVAGLEATLLRRAQLVGVISDAFDEPLRSMGVRPERIRPLPNYALVSPTAVGHAEARAALGWPADRRIVLHTGNMGLKQDLVNVVRAATEAHEARLHDLLFVFVGDGNERAKVRAVAGDLPNVLFVDPLPDDTYPLSLAAADCLLLNERSTVFDMCLPSKLTSYLASGRPVVAATSPLGGAARQLHAARAGVVIPPGRPTELLTAILGVLADPLEAERLGRNGQAYALDHLSVDAARRRIVDFTAELAARPAHQLVGSR